MPVRCAVENCKNAIKKGSDVHFFKFPLLIEPLLRAWVKAVNRKDWKPTKASKICELHFKSTDFVDKPGMKRKLLKPDVIPTENLVSSAQDTGKIPKQVIIIKKCIVTDSVQEHIKLIANINNKIDDAKEKECLIEDPNKRIKELEDEVQYLVGVIKSLQEKMSNDLEVQAEIYRRLMCKEVQKLKEKLKNTQMELKAFKVQTKRKNIKASNKIQMLLEALGKMKLMSSSAYDLLKEEFEYLLTDLFQNEDKNENKLVHSEHSSTENCSSAAT